jgi:hypothetical protein
MRLAPLALLLAAAPVAAAPTPAPALAHRLFIAPEEARTLDSRTLAELLVARIRRECDEAGPPAPGEKALGDDPGLVMMVPASKLDAIARDGFLNQHQTRTTGGQSRERDRFESEQELAMLRLPLGLPELLPKYAIVDAKRSDLGTYPLPVRYGGVAVVFKKEVWARATWTYADSLDFSRTAGRFDAGGAANPVLPHGVDYSRKPGDGNRCGNYCEAQIWGKLRLDDVAYAMVRASEPVPSAFARAAIPVYEYVVPESSTAVVDAGRTAQYERRALLPLGRPARAAPTNVITTGGHAAPGEFTAEQRRIAALAVDGSDPEGLEEAAESGDEQTRALALYGVGGLPWDEVKPLILAALDARKGPLLISAVALASEHRDDSDVGIRLDALRRGPKNDATEWIERLDKARLCDPPKW